MCDICEQGNRRTLVSLTEHTLAMVAFVLSVPRGTTLPGTPAQIREASSSLVKEWANQIFSAGSLHVPAGEASIRMARKYAQWAEKELRGVTMTPSHN